MYKPKKLEDLPQFSVAAVRHIGASRFELAGKFDHAIESTDPSWFWLLIGKDDCLCVTLETLDVQSQTAMLSCDANDEPRVVGMSLACLSAYWQAYHVWMVLDTAWGWEKKLLQGVDAIAEDYDAKDISIVRGREVRVWTKLEPAEGVMGVSRHYPAEDQTLPPSSERRLVAGGWGHEHCELCRTHVDARGIGYCDPGGRWMCQKCYERYVLQRDLSFVDDL
jgi:hypothetical protein